MKNASVFFGRLAIDFGIAGNDDPTLPAVLRKNPGPFAMACRLKVKLVKVA